MKPLVAWISAFVLALASVAAWAQAPAGYPAKPVRLVVPFPAGSLTDIVSRIVAQALAPRLGQQVVVESRSGASGSIGVETVARSAPDGYTLGVITASTHGLSPAFGTPLAYDPVRDFKPVSMIGEAPYVVIVAPTLPVRTLSEFIAHARARPGQINYGSAGPASVANLAALLLAQKTGIDMNHVPYKSTAQSMVDLMAGRLDIQVATVAPTLPGIRDGKLRALATTGRRRIAGLPEVPTMAEAGVKDYIVALWMALAAASATPDAIANRLNADLTAVLTSADTIDALRKQAVEPEAGPASLVTTRIRDEIETWRGLIARMGIKPE